MAKFPIVVQGHRLGEIDLKAVPRSAFREFAKLRTFNEIARWLERYAGGDVEAIKRDLGPLPVQELYTLVIEIVTAAGLKAKG